MAAGAERAVGGQRDSAILACREQAGAVFEGAELHLVHHRACLGDRQHRIDLLGAEVGDPDRARVAAIVRLLHPGPGPGRPVLRPVHEVEVDLVHAEAAQAPLDLGRRVVATGEELRGDEHVLTRDSALTQRLADAGLVAVGLGRVDVAVAGLERPAHRVLAFRAILDLPDTEAEHRHLGAVGERSGLVKPRVHGHGASFIRGLLRSFPELI